MINIEKKFDGLLIIGDPHITSYKPDKRSDEDYLTVCLDKLEQSLEIAYRENLCPILLGDLLSKIDDYNVTALLIKLLNKYKDKIGIPIISNLGNHDVSKRVAYSLRKKINNEKPDEDTDENIFEENENGFYIPIENKSIIAILKASGSLNIFNKIEDLKININNKDCLLKFVPYGIPIPEKIESNQFKNIMFTHHDINFGIGNQYYFSTKIFPINNCDLVINGHIHNYIPPQEVGNTIWYNPGNIIRTSISLGDETPSVSKISLVNNQINIERILLKYKDKKDVFNFVSNDKELEETLENFKSKFVEKLNDDIHKNVDELSNNNNNDLDMIMGDYFIKNKTSNYVIGIIRDLKRDVEFLD